MADTSDSHHEFQKVLRLLHSRAKDSADILKAMLDEVLRNRSKPDQKPSMATMAAAAAKTSVIKGMETSVIKSSSDYKRDNVSQFETNLKRFDTNFDKYRSESFEYPMDRKRQRLDSPQQTSRSTTSSPQPVGAVSGLQLPAKVQSLPVIDEYQFTDTVTTPTAIHTMATTGGVGGAAIKVEDDSETDIEDENTDAGEFAVEMGLACVHCKQIDIAPNNQLVECQECHNLYHQECHRPPLLDRDISDPRFVWYCAKCQKTMKKIAVKPKSGAKASAAAPVAAPAVAQMKEYSLPKALTKGDSSGGGGGADTSAVSGISRLIQPFKREHKVPVPGQPSGAAAAAVSAKPIGLAALANISRSGSVGSGAGAVSAASGAKNKAGNGNNGGSGAVIASQSSATAADKRLQSLKKKSSKK